MENTLKITNVLSDPTRYSIYQYITKNHEEVTVQEVANVFEIHPNVARLHLSKLEDVNMLISETKKTGKGGRPSRLYRLSEDVIQLNFPFRDYQMLSKVAMETLMSLGSVGQKALFETGKRYGVETMRQQLKQRNLSAEALSFEGKVELLNSASSNLGFYPELAYNEDKTKVTFQIHNCPFKEIAKEERYVCDMHFAFLSGMFDVIFTNAQLVEEQNMLSGCASCNYQAMVTK